MTHKEYNGWTNYETWLVKLWMDNDQGLDAYWREIAEECIKTDGECAKGSLADILREQHREQADEKTGNSGWIADLVNAALSEVDWGEIAESLLADCRESVSA